MAGDPGMAYLNGLLDNLYMAQLRRSALLRYREDEAEMDPELEAQSSAAAGLAEDTYEEVLIAEARAMVAGASPAQPTIEHLRVLVGRLAVSPVGDSAPF